MTGLRMALKAFGVEVADEHLRAIEKLIPELPAKLQAAGQQIDIAITNFDQRLRTLEGQYEAMLELMRKMDGNQLDTLSRVKIISQQIELIGEEMKRGNNHHHASTGTTGKSNGRRDQHRS